MLVASDRSVRDAMPLCSSRWIPPSGPFSEHSTHPCCGEDVSCGEDDENERGWKVEHVQYKIACHIITHEYSKFPTYISFFEFLFDHGSRGPPLPAFAARPDHMTLKEAGIQYGESVTAIAEALRRHAQTSGRSDLQRFGSAAMHMSGRWAAMLVDLMGKRSHVQCLKDHRICLFDMCATIRKERPACRFVHPSCREFMMYTLY